MSLHKVIWMLVGCFPLLLDAQTGIEQLSWDELVTIVNDYQGKNLYEKSFPYALRLRAMAIERYKKRGTRYTSTLRKTILASEAVGDWGLTRELWTEFLDLSRREGGKKGLKYALAISQIARAEMKLGFYQKSEALCWQAKDIKVQNPITKRWYPLQYFTASIKQLKNSNQRRAAYREYLDAKVVLISNLNTLSSIYEQRGDKEALDLVNQSALEETASMVRYVLSSTGATAIPAHVISDMSRLLEVFEDFEHYRKGEKLYLETMNMTRGSDLYEPLARKLALIYVKIGELTGAKLMYTHLLRLAEEKHGSESVPFALALADLAAFYMLVEDTSEAAKFYQKSKGIVLRIEGRESDTYIKINKELKNVYRVSQQRDE